MSWFKACFILILLKKKYILILKLWSYALKGGGDEAVQGDDEALNGNGKALKCVGEALENT